MGIHFTVGVLLCFLVSAFCWADDKELSPQDWSIHVQATTINQYHDDFPASYSGTNSLSPSGEDKTSFTSTLFLGRKLWRNGEIYLNPEVAGGTGLSATHGIAGFPNGEIYRVSDSKPELSVSRIYIKEIFGFGSETEKIEDDKNQIASVVDTNRFVFVAGKFSLSDFFDNNTYSHDPRTQFINWSLMDNGAWDYAADTRGYTWGFVIEYHMPSWAVRYSSVLEPLQANQLDLDMNMAQAHGDNLEIEYHYIIQKHPGAARLLGFVNHAFMGSYQDVLAAHGTDVTQTRSYRTKSGAGINLEQEISSELGTFFRAGWNDGKTESWAFAEIDNTFSLGASLKGTSWERPDDVLGFAFVINGISNDHSDYLASGGYGFMIGDGNINYGPEQVLESYYSFQFLKIFAASLDYQFVNNPAYNRDRGPVSVYSGRLHCEF